MSITAILLHHWTINSAEEDEHHAPAVTVTPPVTDRRWLLAGTRLEGCWDGNKCWACQPCR